MRPIELSINELRGISRDSYIIEQGIPVPGITPEEAQELGVVDESGNSTPHSHRAPTAPRPGALNRQ